MVTSYSIHGIKDIEVNFTNWIEYGSLNIKITSETTYSKTESFHEIILFSKDIELLENLIPMANKEIKQSEIKQK